MCPNDNEWEGNNEIEDFLFSLQIEDLLKESFISLHFIHSEDKQSLSSEWMKCNEMNDSFNKSSICRENVSFSSTRS